MKLLSLTVVCLPVVSANYPWWTKGGWAKPADFTPRSVLVTPILNTSVVRCPAQEARTLNQIHFLGGAILVLWQTLRDEDATGRVLLEV
ncbi:uncharacterized protein FPRO_08742 [Fusarium proliferatum ET1]|uniref:Uncharacterized protein n=1 Tax=Fusarium proliferatum (strain ET1) TaxID=1227346 RepID=A0A1L7W411_FUSPR|nr:uncharacterized protein FPRO_08742 [Fusarium proliferatum ET1]CZR47368.1 uncharacterized protein FPRO_08742 [Fusarium proliferatum ET1]